MNNVPNLRFPEFQGEWRRSKFKKVITLQRGSSPRPIIKYITTSTDGVNWVKIGDMPHFGRIVTSTEEKITREGAKKSRLVKKGDLILSNSMSYGLPYIMGIDGYIHDGWFVLKDFDDTFDKDYLCNLLISSTIQNQYKRLAAGGVVQNISSDLVNSVSVSIPLMEEQKKISSLLNFIDDRIATQNKIIDKLQSLIKGIAQHCIRELINGWEYVRLGDICKITTGKLDANAQVENGQYPFFTCAERPFNINSYAFDTEALLISGNGANLGYINYYKGKFNAYQRTYVLDLFSVNIHYVKWALKVLLPQRIAIEKSSSNTPYIVLSTLANLKIPIPNNSKQNHIANLMMSFERKLSTQLALSDLYNKQKQYLLRQMFI